MLPQSHFIAFNDIKSKHFSNAVIDSSASVHQLFSIAGRNTFIFMKYGRQ